MASADSVGRPQRRALCAPSSMAMAFIRRHPARCPGEQACRRMPRDRAGARA
jgi:hypothetical protein